MKIKPVMDALAERDAETVLVHTGQHYDPLMSAVFFDELGLRPPDHHLDVGSGSHAQQTAAVMLALEPLLESSRPDVVVVAGDVNSTMAAALVAAKAGALVAHVEAGLRSRDWSMPEEINRIVADRVSDYLFAPSADAVRNLEREGYRPDQIHLVGNVMVDTLLANLDRARRRPVLDDLGLSAGGYGLVTLHRPANVDRPDVLGEIMRALSVIAADLPIVLPAHPRSRAAGVPPGLRVIEPLGYLDFIALEADAALVLTDSGGVQEETTVLGVPCLTLRDNTERPITVHEGTNRVVGTDGDRIVDAARQALAGEVAKVSPTLWDGHAAQRIADVLLAGDRPLRPSQLSTGAVTPEGDVVQVTGAAE
jgi:UDP-N-acetylglucosamine 2-epimerase (non-hydrolysing)